MGFLYSDMAEVIWLLSSEFWKRKVIPSIDITTMKQKDNINFLFFVLFLFCDEVKTFSSI